QYWMLYSLSGAGWAGEHIRAIFSTTPRMMAASFAGYIVSQRFDVWLYHRWWDFTTKRFGDAKRFLWLRNNGSTMISQLINTVIFTTVAFAGWYDNRTLMSVMVSSYIVYLFTSLLDTPAVYLARWMKERGWVRS
ncbi:MAG: queuosine precursor transporter, partial [Clostridia bacterium]|nr:queuosine precursor transporter [Clostridia bacterium]